MPPHQIFGPLFAEGDAAFAGACGVVGFRAFAGPCSLLQLLIQLQQFAAAQAAEGGAEGGGLFAHEGENLFLFSGFSHGIALAEARDEGEPAEGPAGFAHAAYPRAEARGKPQGQFPGEPELSGKGGNNRLGAAEAAVKEVKSGRGAVHAREHTPAGRGSQGAGESAQSSTAFSRRRSVFIDKSLSVLYHTRMETRVIEVDLLDDCRRLYREAADVLAAGGLVALPTETVYGLGADAFNTEAVAEVFAVKERPSFDPLICHLAGAKELDTIAEVPAELRPLVDTLAKNFWPGPMTLVLPRKACVPDIVTSGLPTVAIRVPSHEVMRGVARALGHPIAAPSANRFGHISPTSAAAVVKELGGRIPLVLDAGACSEGLESTILMPCLDEKGKPAVRLLREGPLVREKLRGLCKVIRPSKREAAQASAPALPNAPGQLKAHYAPRKPLILLGEGESFEPQEGVSYGLISYEGESELAAMDCWAEVMPLSPGKGRLAEAAVRLFAVMRAMDECEAVDVIIAESLPETGLGCAMMDRLRRAAAGAQQQDEA